MRKLLSRSLGAATSDVTEERIDEAMRVFQQHYGAHCLDHTRLYPGLDAALREMRQVGHRLAVLTNKPRKFSEDILLGLGVRDLFDRVLGGDDLPTRKPDPAGLLGIVDECGCTPGDTVLVGDSDVDIETAHNARVSACAVTWGFDVPSKIAEARYAVDAPGDLLRIV